LEQQGEQPWLPPGVRQLLVLAYLLQREQVVLETLCVVLVEELKADFSTACKWIRELLMMCRTTLQEEGPLDGLGSKEAKASSEKQFLVMKKPTEKA
jgi:hypothetical protein